MLDNAAIFLSGPRQEAGNVHKGQDRNVEAVTKPHETRRLARAVDIEAAGQHHRLVGDDPDRRTLHAREADNDVARKVRLDLEEVGIVDDLLDQLFHVIGLVGIARDKSVERGLDPVGRVSGGPQRRRPPVRGGQEIHEAAQFDERLDIVLESEIGNARALRMRQSAAQFLLCHGLMRDGLHHLRPGHEHVRGVLDHKDEIGHRRRIDGAAGARPHDHRHLRDHAGGEHIALEDLGIAGERSDPVLDPGSA